MTGTISHSEWEYFYGPDPAWPEVGHWLDSGHDLTTEIVDEVVEERGTYEDVYGYSGVERHTTGHATAERTATKLTDDLTTSYENKYDAEHRGITESGYNRTLIDDHTQTAQIVRTGFELDFDPWSQATTSTTSSAETADAKYYKETHQAIWDAVEEATVEVSWDHKTTREHTELVLPEDGEGTGMATEM